MPLVTIVEEVMDSNSIEAATGVSHLTQFVRKLEAAGRSVVVFMLDHGIFTGKPRCRWYIAGVSPECGGEEGASPPPHPPPPPPPPLPPPPTSVC